MKEIDINDFFKCLKFGRFSKLIQLPKYLSKENILAGQHFWKKNFAGDTWEV